MPTDSPLLPILLIHDGELSDVADLLAHLGLEYSERQGAADDTDEQSVWDLVIATPKRLLEFDPGPSGTMPQRAAILEKDSRTLRSMLQRAGVDLIVLRPVHPAALRLLVLHCMYRGPEKRRALRVSIGARVKFRTGLRSRSCVLADLSTTGCRLLSKHRVTPGTSLKIQVGDDIAANKSFTLRGSVVRVTRSDFPGIDTLAVQFAAQKSKVVDRLRQTIAAFSGGPAALAPGDRALALPLAPSAPAAPEQGATVVDAPTVETRVTVPEDPQVTPTAEPATVERRKSGRHAYETRVVALGVEAARVLLGRDISLGGMRVEAHPDLAVDDELEIGLHVRGRDIPVVVNARVVRDDGDDGIVLQFFDLDESSQEYLQRMEKFLPILACRDSEGEDSGVIVCEILQHDFQDLGQREAAR